MLFFSYAYYKENENCVAAIGALHFSVRSFGCALFYYTKWGKGHEEKNFKHIAYVGNGA